VSFPTSLPNVITLGRLLAVPLMVWLVLSDRMTTAFWVFVAAGVSDGVDGYIAKRFDAVTKLGSYLDPLADKAMLVTIYVTLGIAGEAPSWLVILIVFRDTLIVGGALLIHTLDLKMRVEPLLISKINTVMQIILAAFLLARLGLGLEDYGLITVLIYVVAATTVGSGLTYLKRLIFGIGGNGRTNQGGGGDNG
jgi:cardiolipin synthase